MKSAICVLGLVLAGAATTALCPANAADLASYQTIYQKGADDVLSGYQDKFAKLQSIYLKALEDQRQAAVQQGDLSKVKALQAEIERFQGAKTLPAEAGADPIQEIKACQAGYVKQYSKVEAEMIAALGTLTGSYEQALGRMQRELVRAEKLEEATAVDEERKRVQAVRLGYAEHLAALAGASAAATNAPVATAAAAPALKRPGKDDLFLVVDLSGGERVNVYPVVFLAEAPKGGWGEEHKTDKLVLRRMNPVSFTMGSPDDELGRGPDENRHDVTLTRPFYIGVFEVTQRQWERVTGDWPSLFGGPKYRNARPVENVSYSQVRGTRSGQEWPVTKDVDKNSFVGKLRAKTGKAFDLPTEAQWECACRAGVARAINSGSNIRSLESDPALAAVGRYKCNSGGLGVGGEDDTTGTATVGSYRPNDAGLYDMHGNVWEWCLDWYGEYAEKEADPAGPRSGSARVMRGGSWRSDANHCRSANRHEMAPDDVNNHVGFRLVLTVDP